MAFSRTDKKCSLQNLPSKGSALVSMRRPPICIIPGAVTAVAENLRTLVPGPQLNHAMQPKIQMERTNVAGNRSNLLLACSFDFLNITEVLFNRISVSNSFKNLLGRRRQIRAHKGPEAVLAFANDKRLNQTTGGLVQGLEDFNLFEFFFAVEQRFDLKPAFRIIYNVRKFDSLAVLSRSASFAFSWLFKFGIKHSVFSQSGDDRDSHFNNRLEKAGPGKAAVGNYPKSFSKVFAATISPFRQFHRLFGFTEKRQAYLADVFGFNIEPCQQRQADSSKGLMPCNGRQGHPHMAIDELSAVRCRRGVAMNSCTGDLRAVSYCRTIIDSSKNSVCICVNSAYHNLKQFGRYVFSFLRQRTDKVIVGLVTAVNTCCPKPACNGSSASGKEHSCQDDSQSPLRALMQDTAKGSNRYLPEIRENPFVEHWLSFPNVSLLRKTSEGRAIFIYPLSADLRYQLSKS